MGYKSGICFVCEESKAVQDHHLLPLEYGGAKDGPQIKICPHCHLVCHYEADIFYRTGEFSELHIRFKKSAVYDRALKVINYIVQQHAQFDAGNKPAEDARRKVGFSVSHDELQLLHAAKRVQGFTSLERFLKGCVTAVITDMRRKGRI